MIRGEWLLLAMLVGLYVYSGALLLYVNEALLYPAGKQWRTLFGTDNLTFRGRELVLTHLLWPHRPLYRLSWSFEAPGTTQDAPDSIEKVTAALRPLALCIWGMAAALFVLLPLGLFTALGIWAVLAAISVFYLGAGLALIMIFCRRRVLQLSKRQFLALAFEALICPPFALCLIQRVSTAYPIKEDFSSRARAVLNQKHQQHALQECLRRLDEAINMTPENAPNLHAMQQRRAALAAEESRCQ